MSTRGVDPDDPLWEFEPGDSGVVDISETVDAVLYDQETSRAVPAYLRCSVDTGTPIGPREMVVLPKGFAS